MNEIKEKIKDLELALNYVCYDADLIPKLQTVWQKLELLQEVVNKNDLLPDVMHIVCPNCGCNKMQDDGGNYYTCLNVLCDFHGQIMPQLLLGRVI